MKKIININLVILFIVLFANLSCKKYLDHKPNATLIIPKKLVDLQSLMDDVRVLNIESVPGLSENYSDDWYMKSSDIQNMNDIMRNIYVRNSFEYSGGYNDWSRSYQAIYYCNYVLEQLKQLDISKHDLKKWNQVKGTAYFYRAFHFLTLLVQFSHAYDPNTSDTDLGIVLRETSNFNDLSTRSTVSECYQHIINYLHQSSELLPEYPEHVLRPSKIASLALLARVYLYMGDFENTKIYAEKALKYNSQLIDFNGDEDLLVTAKYPIKKYNKETIFYGESAYFFYHSVLHPIDSVLFAMYEDNDLRKQYYFEVNNGDAFFRGNYSGGPSSFGGITTSELYLMSAEAKAQLNDVSGALNDLESLLAKRYKAGELNINKEISVMQAISLIRQERRKELLIRNLRWIDIKRYNKMGANIILERNINNILYLIPPNSSIYALPLPKDIVEISGIKQN